MIISWQWKLYKMNIRHNFSNDKCYQANDKCYQANNNNNRNLVQGSRGYNGFICMYIGIIPVRNDAIDDA
jgi:hypothetical protein